MCLLALAWKLHPRWPVVLAANRDESYARPTLDAHRWPDFPQVLGGQDVDFGGTWLGVSEDGRLACVTNVRNPADRGVRRRSRGLLTRSFLTGELDLEGLRALDLAAFNAFNLLVIEDGRAAFLTNRPAPRVMPLEPGFYGLSNGTLDEPWPKTEALKAAVRAWIESEDVEFEPLFAALADEGRAPDHALPDTGVGLEHERLLSAAFIRGEVYGTRASTLLRIAADGTGELAERTFGPHGAPLAETTLDFRWPS